MSSLIVEVLPIEEIQTHPNADRLELARIKGWWCAVPKDQYKVNDIVVYIPPDAVLPVELSDKIGVTKYLSKGRVKTSKLRGSYSQGIIVSPETLQISNYTIGEDVQKVLGITKYEPPFLPSTMGGIEIRCPSSFVQYTDIENYKNYPNVLTSGEEVCISEKIHGCFPFSTQIKMADGTIKPINKINVGDCVLGYNNGKIKPAKVLKTYNNGKCKKWLTIQGKRCGVGKGNAFFSLHCTPNHQLYDPELNVYRNASSFKIGDSILMLRSDKPLMVKVKITSIVEDLKVRSNKYDIETETHNFFASNILVHNSNFRAGKFDDIFYVGSHRRALQEDDSILYWKAAKLYDLKSILPNNSVFFGEVFGKGVQKLHYDRKRIDIAFFDMIVDGRYVNFNELGYFLTHNNLPSVPILFIGEWDTSLLTYAAGPSAIAKHIKEGIVIKPLIERFDLTIGRVVLKYINEAYLLHDYGDLH